MCAESAIPVEIVRRNFIEIVGFKWSESDIEWN